MKALFFTDIDGTLLDHYSYSYEQSIPGIRTLADNHIPLIAVSSKTFDEMQILLENIGIRYPFSFENGAGTAYPDTKGGFTVSVAGASIPKLTLFLHELEKLSGKQLTAITSLSDIEISDLTGLDTHSSVLVKKRRGSLPFIVKGENLLSDDEIININAKIKKNGFYITKGGRFNHLLPALSGKEIGVKKIIEFYLDSFNDAIITAAAGDSVNDIPMFETVDYPYIVRKPGGSHISFKSGRVMSGEGPAGFTEAVDDFIGIITG